MISYIGQETINITGLVYTADIGEYVAKSTDNPAYVRPLTEEESQVNEIQYGRGFFVMVYNTVDVEETDTVVWNSTDYTIQGVSIQKRGFSIPDFKQIIMFLPVQDSDTT
jgi:hypothetical protein